MTPGGTDYEEWRLAFDVPKGGPRLATLADTLRRRLPPSIDVHRRGKVGMGVYARTQAEIDRAFDVIGQELVSARVQANILLSRWNPGAGQWQAPSLPIDPVPEPLPDPWADVDEFAWEVRLRFHHESDAARVAHELEEQGAAVLEGWKRCLVALPDEATARTRAEQLRAAAPRAVIEVRPLSRYRRWQIRQQVFGNYAGRDPGEGGRWSGD